MGTNPSSFKCGNDETDSYYAKGGATSALPVENVNWYHAIAYCNKLSILEGKELCYSIKDGSGNEIDFDTLTYKGIPVNVNDTRCTQWDAAIWDDTKNGYRLPCEAEWEYAARGGRLSQSNSGKNLYDYDYSGSNNICEVAWCSGNNNTTGTCAGDYKNVHGTKPVATKSHNELDLFDMSGNVWEWCWNFWTYNTNEPHDPGTGTNRILHGGSWNYDESFCRVSIRHNDSPPYHRGFTIGFRVACNSQQ
jgi:formylglycine-generating enzyme required for sulfatase activity